MISNQNHHITAYIKHLNLWDVKRKPHLMTSAPPGGVLIDYLDSQIPPCDDYIVKLDIKQTKLRDAGYLMLDAG